MRSVNSARRVEVTAAASSYAPEDDREPSEDEADGTLRGQPAGARELRAHGASRS